MPFRTIVPLVLLLAGTQAQPLPVTFHAPTSFAVAGSPIAVVTADFNNDGKPDVAVLDAGGVSILLGAGQGNFQPAVNYPVSGAVNLQGLAVADFNGDGYPDIAVLNVVNSGGDVAILFGNGDGTFQPGTVTDVSQDPDGIVTGDFNGDGVPDLALCNFYGFVSILLGKGDGTFQPPLVYELPGIAYAITLGDFNNDGRLDLAVACGSLVVLLGNGDGTFQALAPVSIEGGAQAIVAADFNGDGNLDLAIGNQESPGVYISLGNGDGTFQPQIAALTNYGAYSLAVADFNGDGKPDLAVATNFTISILLGKGNGEFRTSSFADGDFDGSLPGAPIMAVADFNGDGVPDLAVGCMIASVSIRLGDGKGKFVQPRSVAAGKSPSFVVSADFNGDGKPDLAVSDAGSGAISILLGKGQGAFQRPVRYAVGSRPNYMAVGDFNNDGYPDLVVVNDKSNTVSVLLNNGDGTFQPQAVYATNPDPGVVVVADLNGDGIPDLAVTSTETNSDVITVLYGHGDGTFQPEPPLKIAGTAKFLAAGDFNSDGNTDLLVIECPRRGCGITTYLGNGTGAFQAGPVYPVSSRTAFLVAADFNGDGILDLAVSGDLTDVRILLGKGGGSFSEGATYNIAGGGRFSVADFNGDGTLDIAVAGDVMVSFLLGNGDGTFVPQDDFYYVSGATPGNMAAVGDFNGGGLPGLAVAGPKSGNVAILINATE